MRQRIAAGFAAVTLLAACNKDPDAGPAGGIALRADDPAPLGRLGDEVTPSAYRLELDIDPREARFSGTVAIDVDLAREASRLWLHGKDLTVDSAYATYGDGERVDARYQEVDVTGVARLDFARPLPAGPATLHLDYSAPFRVVPDALYRTEEGGEYYAATQLQSISARNVFPGFDEPRFKTPFSIEITARATDFVATVAPEATTEDTGDGRTRHVFAVSDPIPTYLLAFVVGPYDVNDWQPIPANDVREVPVPLRGIAARGKGGRMDYALGRTAGFVHLLEEYFDVPYAYHKLDIIAAPDFFGGAMENVGAIMYNEFLLLMDENSAYGQRRSYTQVHAHELAHQWFGDLVTPAWWDDIWLNESFATWMEYKMAAELWPEGQFDRGMIRDGLHAMASDSLASARQVREPVELNATINDAFDTITYEKGGAVLTMFESYLGEAAFREGVRTHIRRFAHGTATVDDFMQSLAEGSGRGEVVPAFRSFIEQPGVPLVEVALDCGGEPTLEIRQSRYAPLGSAIDTDRTWRIPMCASWGAGGASGRSCAMIDTEQASMPLGTADCPDLVVPNAGGAGYYRFALDDAGWAALAAAAPGLDAGEALAYADSLDAAFRAGEASADAYLDGMSALARHPAWDALSETMDRYEAVMDIAPDDAAREQLETFGRRLFRPVYDALGDADDPQSVLLGSNLTRFLAIVGNDPGLREDVLDDARRYVGVDGGADPGAIAADLIEAVLSVGVQEDGADFFDALLQGVRQSDDPAFRRYGLGALASTADPELSRRLLEAVTQDDFSRQEMQQVLSRQLARVQSRDVAWSWVRENVDEVIESSGGIVGVQAVVGLGKYFCSAQEAKDHEALILAHRAELPGYERTLAQVLESIELCSALKAAQAAALAAAAAERL